MNENLSKKITEIELKLNWTKRSFENIKANRNNQTIIQDNFWSFLSGFQQGWYYFGKFIEDEFSSWSKNKRELLKNDLINKFKTEYLTTEELEAWDLLQKMRNFDIHNEPVSANYEIKKYAITTNSGIPIADNSGRIIVTSSNIVYVLFNDKKFEVSEICKNGIISIEKLICFLKEFDIENLYK